eukprot:774503-Rhodomonas_salina.1
MQCFFVLFRARPRVEVGDDELGVFLGEVACELGGGLLHRDQHVPERLHLVCAPHVTCKARSAHVTADSFRARDMQRKDT